MGLEYWKDGKKIEVHAIYNHGHVGQIVILDSVSFNENNPLFPYPQPSAFTIMEIAIEKGKHNVSYTLRDSTGKCFTMDSKETSSWFLYDANEWFVWKKAHDKEKLGRKERKIEQLEGHLALLKDILTKQGFRVISEDQAKKLGIE